jgi:enoyl-CoA hydratase/carnithine racemase
MVGRTGDFHGAAALRREADAQAAAYGSADLREGVEALLDRRRPAFTGV